MIVLDTSVALTWFLPDEFPPVKAESKQYVVQSGALVPTLWFYEIANGLLMAVRRDRLLYSDGEDALALLDHLPIQQDMERVVAIWPEIFRIATSHGLTAYDATYLELAVRRRLPLATLDKKLVEAARAEGVRIFGQNG